MENSGFWKIFGRFAGGALCGGAVLWGIEKGRSRSDEEPDFVIDFRIRHVEKDEKENDGDGEDGYEVTVRRQRFDEEADNLVDCDDDDFDCDTDWDGDDFPTYYDPGDAW